MKQLALLQSNRKTAFGGSLLKGNHPNGPRPVSSKHAMHIVLRSEIAKGPMSMRKHRFEVDGIIRRQAENWGIKIYRYANVGNHLHVLARMGSRRRFQGFLRSISGLIARAVMGAERGRSVGKRFWQARPFSRIVRWGRDYVKAKNYVDLNAREALGFLSPRMLVKLGSLRADDFSSA